MSRIARCARRKNIEPPTSMSGIGCTLLGTEVRRHRMSQVQRASVSGRASAVRGSPLSELTPNKEQEGGRDAHETVERPGADKSTPPSASPLQGRSFAPPDSKESDRHCGSNYGRQPDDIAVASRSL